MFIFSCTIPLGLSSYLGRSIPQEGQGFEALRFELPQISGISLSSNPNNDPQHSLLQLSNLHDPLLFKLFWLQVNLSNKFYTQPFP